MKVLFVHQNFPGQFRYLAPALAAQGHEVSAFKLQNAEPATWQGVRVVPYPVSRGTSPNVHPWVSDFETKTIRGEAAFRAALGLKGQGYAPDVIVAHPGWGESLFLKDVWPHARLGIYCEFYYRPEGADVGFDAEFPVTDPGEVPRLRLKNLNNALHFDIADAGISPTQWQAGTFPDPFRRRISVIHDGIDTDVLAPNPDVSATLPGNVTLGRAAEVITFVNRNLEPYRGYHVFMRALPEILSRRPKAHVMIVGGDDVSYGPRAPDGRKWKDVFLDEVKDRVDLKRVHFLGVLPYQHFVRVLQLSTVHVYLTYPFVLSWSLLEAMSIGCAIVASDTGPVREAIRDGDTGRLVNFFDSSALAESVCTLLQNPGERSGLGANARHFARATYDLRTLCLPRQIEWVHVLAENR